MYKRILTLFYEWPERPSANDHEKDPHADGPAGHNATFCSGAGGEKNATETGHQVRRSMNAGGNKISRKSRLPKQDIKEDALDAKVKTKRATNKALKKTERGLK